MPLFLFMENVRNFCYKQLVRIPVIRGGYADNS